MAAIKLKLKVEVEVEDVRPPCWWSTELHQHGGSILGSVNWRKTFRRISEVWENAETQNLEKCLLYLSPII